MPEPPVPIRQQTANTPPRLIRAAAVRGFGDLGPDTRDGGVLIRDGLVIEVGPADDLRRRHGVDREGVTHLDRRLLVPGLVNAHCHLELTALGPQPYGGDFIGWVQALRAQTAKWSGENLLASAKRGAEAALQAGTAAVGDIAGSDATAAVRKQAGLAGVSFRELFGMGPPWDEAALARLQRPADGFQPHAPYSAGPRLFEAATQTGRPLCCHLAETRDECRFIEEGDGPFLDLLKQLGKWSSDFAGFVGRGLSPVQWTEPYLRAARWLVAHVNYASDDDLRLLAETQTSVAYCPIASDYFGHTDHRYRQMLEAGINVCLGTDSIVCQPADEPQPLGILPQMRHLWRRDHTEPATLLAMATDHGRRALSLNASDHTRLAALRFDPDDPADALTQVLSRREPAETVELQNET